jgi:hypothetical protein
MAIWQPQEQALQQLLLLLGDATNPDNTRDLALINQVTVQFII